MADSEFIPMSIRGLSASSAFAQQQRRTYHIIATVIGLLLGIISAIVVGHSMVEVTFSPAFAMIFGAMLIALACTIGVRTLVSFEEEVSLFAKAMVIGFCGLMFVSGLLCLLLDIRIVYSPVNYLYKVPLYTLLGSAVNFAFTYAVLDLLTMGFFTCTCLRNQAKTLPLVTYPIQIFLVCSAAIVLGGLYGFVFAMLDIQDIISSEWLRHRKFLEQQLICVPVSACVNGLVALLNYRIGVKNRIDRSFDPASNRGEGI